MENTVENTVDINKKDGKKTDSVFINLKISKEELAYFKDTLILLSKLTTNKNQYEAKLT